jgi:hypothetical protein
VGGGAGAAGVGPQRHPPSDRESSAFFLCDGLVPASNSQPLVGSRLFLPLEGVEGLDAQLNLLDSVSQRAGLATLDLPPEDLPCLLEATQRARGLSHPVCPLSPLQRAKSLLSPSTPPRHWGAAELTSDAQVLGAVRGDCVAVSSVAGPVDGLRPGCEESYQASQSRLCVTRAFVCPSCRVCVYVCAFSLGSWGPLTGRPPFFTLLC